MTGHRTTGHRTTLMLRQTTYIVIGTSSIGKWIAIFLKSRPQANLVARSRY
jgi:hypothetical protein